MTTMLTGFRGLNVDLTLTVINNTLGKLLYPQRPQPVAQPTSSLDVSFFLLNEADIFAPSFLPSLMVLLRRRN